MLLTHPEVVAALLTNCPVAVGVSGGKDSCAVALAIADYLAGLGHTGPHVLIHSDLGRVEWRDSLPTCERLAARLGWPLIVVRRKAGDMLARWQQRWVNNVRRWENLECVKLILPWSTPSMRFCTSELKADVISSELKRQFPGRLTLSVTGIRAEESPGRAKAPVCKPNAKMKLKNGTDGLDWHPIHAWTTQEVLAYLKVKDFELHEAYRIYGSSRVSCVACIMSSQGDLLAATRCVANADVYREMVALELRSSFSFQGGKWLADVAPELLTPAAREFIATAKAISATRVEIEALIPKHLHYTAGWPEQMPTLGEARLLADVRTRLGVLMGLVEANYVTTDSVMRRYKELMDKKKEKE